MAIFQEMASKPTTVVAMNVAIAYGCILGHKCTVADAIKAYVQSPLKSKVPTWLEIPKYLCPDEWKHIHRPCVRLIKALYGHPEAGGHWENHLTEIVMGVMKGQKVKHHHSCFWFPNEYLLLIVNVDDLLLSGPSQHHEAFWAKLKKHVSLEPHEDLDRFLGRHHSFTECDRYPLDLIEHFKSPIDA